MATQITATLPTLNFPKEVDYPTQEDWAAFSAAAELNFGILGGSWSTQMQLWKNQANAMSSEVNNSADIAQSIANYQGDWTSKGYTLGQSVSVSGIYYICKLTHATGQNPTDVSSLYWNLAIGNWNLKVDTNMSGYTSQTTPVDADLIPLSDSASSFGIKKLSWANTKATLKTYFDTLYLAYVDEVRIGLIDYGYVAKNYHIVAFGGEFNRLDYPKLWAYLQANPTLVKTQAQWQTEATANDGICGFFSSGNGTTTFRVPNLDKAFLRPDNRSVGSYQNDEFKSHTHSFLARDYGTSPAGGGLLVSSSADRGLIGYTGGTETRPKNIAVLPLIVAK